MKKFGVKIYKFGILKIFGIKPVKDTGFNVNHFSTINFVSS